MRPNFHSLTMIYRGIDAARMKPTLTHTALSVSVAEEGGGYKQGHQPQLDYRLSLAAYVPIH